MQVLAFSAAVTGTGITNLYNCDSNNFTLSSTVPNAYTAIFSASNSIAIDTTTININGNNNGLFFASVNLGQIGAGATTGTGSVTLFAADQLTPDVIRNLSSAQLAALLVAPISNPEVFQSIPMALTGVTATNLSAVTALTASFNTLSSNLIALIPRYVRNAMTTISAISPALTNGLTNPGWRA
jgi:hypothetical protein